MSRKANPKSIGGFVLGAAVLFVAGVVAFGGSRFFEKIENLVMFFPGSVQGLRVGAPVTFRGVPVGEVRSIHLLYNVDTLQFLTLVETDVVSGSFTDFGIDEKTKRPVLLDTNEEVTQEEMDRLIQKGLRAQLVQQSFVTGQLAVQFSVFADAGEPILYGLDPDRIEMPTIPSTFEKLENTLRTIAQKLENLDIEEITADLQATTKAIRELTTRPELQEAVVNANDALREARGLLASLNTRVDPLADSVEDTLGEAHRLLVDAGPAIADARKTLAGAQKTLARAETLMATAKDVIEPGSPLHFEMTTTLREIAGAARSLRSLADTLERNPNALLFGRQKPGGR